MYLSRLLSVYRLLPSHHKQPSPWIRRTGTSGVSGKVALCACSCLRLDCAVLIIVYRGVYYSEPCINHWYVAVALIAIPSEIWHGIKRHMSPHLFTEVGWRRCIGSRRYLLFLSERGRGTWQIKPPDCPWG